MKIKIGEWVRTKKGLIAKVCAYQDLKIYDNEGKKSIFYSFDTDKGTVADIEIAKHSKKYNRFNRSRRLHKFGTCFRYNRRIY